MLKRYGFWVLILPGLLCGCAVLAAAQNTVKNDVIRVEVNLVQMNIAVTDSKGNYITGLRPEDFSVTEDRIPQKIAIFEEGNAMPRNVADIGPPSAAATGKPGAGQAPMGPQDGSAETLGVAMAGANVFILFDTSNYMYVHQGFVLAQDAIADFVRSLEGADRVAFYSYSRNVSREAQLTADRGTVLRGVRDTVAGDDAALYDALLLTLKDAGRIAGKKVVVVFSNGPDNASAVGPEDVREMAQTEGIPIYMISTQEARLDPVSTAVFERVSATTGGKVYFAKNWKEQQDAFASIRDDLAHLYSISYYPAANPNRGWRSITVKLVGHDMKSYHVRTRNGYRPKAVRLTEQIKATS